MRSLGSSRGLCEVCGGTGKVVTKILGVCVDCIRERHREASQFIENAHRAARERWGLPAEPPRTPGGVGCDLCSNQCRMGDREKGFCGLRWNDGGLRSPCSKNDGLLYAYLDPHVTNCCSAWFCPGGTGAGYPRYAYRRGPEHGYSNLSVFMYGCNFDCLFCQNPSHKDIKGEKPVSVKTFSRWVEGDPTISCICFFGGSPEPQLPFAIEASEVAIEARGDRPLRICFEWNGCGDPSLVRRAAEFSLRSGGNVKFDLKCFTPELSLALSGVSNERAFSNFRMIAEGLHRERPEMPLLTATTLLVPDYVAEAQVEAIAKFIAELDPSIPYGLLVYHPAFQMTDLPITPIKQVIGCYRAASKHLKRVHVGNLGLLGLGNMSQFHKKYSEQ